jgi:hypothetical protein
MPTVIHLLRVKPDPRGCVALGKAIEAINDLLATEITGFDILLNADGSLLLTPTDDIPARRIIRLNPQDFTTFTGIIKDDSGPKAELLPAAEAYRAEIEAGTVKAPSDHKTIDLEHSDNPRLRRNRPGTREPAYPRSPRKGGGKRSAKELRADHYDHLAARSNASAICLSLTSALGHG